MSIGDMVVLAVIVAASVLSVISIARGKTGGCDGDCQNCSKNCK